MNINTKVSILVPIYGVEKFIERCAISLFDQTFQDIEYIFVNDCTPDESIDVLKNTLERYPHRKAQVKIINHKVNSGIAETRNTLLDNATGDYILFVDSDDYLEINAVELLYYKAMLERSEIVVCDFYEVFETDLVESKQIVEEHKNNFLKSIISVQTLVPFWNKLIKRELFTKHNIRAKKGFNYGEDYLVMTKIIYFATRISKVDKSLYYYSQTNNNSYTSQKLSKKHTDSIIFALNNLTLFFKDKEDNALYENALIQGKLRKKMDMLFFADKKYIKELNALFPETNDLKDKTFLLSRDKISYPLLKRNYIGLFLLYRNIYKLLFNIKSNLAKK